MNLAVIEGLEQLEANILRLVAQERQAEIQAVTECVQVCAAYAIANHPWTARTGATDATTQGTLVKADEEEIVGALSAGMSYDEFLELAHGGKWAWLFSAMMACRDQMIEILRRYGVIGLSEGIGHEDDDSSTTRNQVHTNDELDEAVFDPSAPSPW